MTDKPSPTAELKRLRAFVCELLADWSSGGDWKGGNLQDLAVKHDILTPEVRHEPCEPLDVCHRLDYYGSDDERHHDWRDGITCYRKPEWMR